MQLDSRQAFTPPPDISSILLVDDNSGIRSSLPRAIQRRKGCRVETASCCEEALAKLSADIGLSLIDIDLGEGEPDGIDLVGRMRGLGHLGFICMLTGSSNVHTLARALHAGANDYLLKPISIYDTDVDYVFARARGEIVPGTEIDPRIHGRFLIGKGALEEQIPTLCAFHNLGYPDDKILADALGENASTITKRLGRARERLGLENRYQLVHLLTVLSGFGARYGNT